MTIFIGAIGLVAIPDAPVNTRAIWLSKEEKALSLARMTEVGIKGQDRIPGKVLWRKLKGIATSPITYIFLAGCVTSHSCSPCLDANILTTWQIPAVRVESASQLILPALPQGAQPIVDSSSCIC